MPLAKTRELFGCHAFVLLGVNLWTAHSLEEKLHGRAAAVNPLVFIAASVVGAHKGVTFGDGYPLVLCDL
jgi:hypothetical protein